MDYQTNVEPSLIKDENNIARLCNELSLLVITENEETVINELKIKYSSYINKSKPIEYAQLTKFIFEEENKRPGNLLSNLTSLIEYMEKNNSKSEEEEKICFFFNKLLVHYNLATVQRQYIINKITAITFDEVQKKQLEDKFNESIKKTETKFFRTINNTLKNHVAVLGIFTSIVFTFIGGFNFATSILQNISNTSFYKLLVLAIIIGMTLYVLLTLLYNFIFKILDKKESLIDERHIVCIGFIIFIAVLSLIIAFYFDMKICPQLYKQLISN